MLSSTVPAFLVGDVRAAAAWYRDALGFQYARFWGEPPVFVILWRDAAEIMLRQCPEGVQPNSRTAEDMYDAYVRVRDLDALHQELIERGVAIQRGPETMPYNCRELEVADLDGYRLCFGECE